MKMWQSILSWCQYQRTGFIVLTIIKLFPLDISAVRRCATYVNYKETSSSNDGDSTRTFDVEYVTNSIPYFISSVTILIFSEITSISTILDSSTFVVGTISACRLFEGHLKYFGEEFQNMCGVY